MDKDSEARKCKGRFKTAHSPPQEKRHHSLSGMLANRGWGQTKKSLGLYSHNQKIWMRSGGYRTWTLRTTQTLIQFLTLVCWLLIKATRSDEPPLLRVFFFLPSSPHRLDFTKSQTTPHNSRSEGVTAATSLWYSPRVQRLGYLTGGWNNVQFSLRVMWTRTPDSVLICLRVKWFNSNLH